MTTTTFQLDENVCINTVITEPTAQDQTKPTLVFLHYWGGSSKTWSKVIDVLHHEYPTVAIDLRGWGDSTGPSTGSDAYSIELMTSDVEAIIKKLELTNYYLVGLSMGAKICQLIAGKLGEGASASGLKGLVLTSPAPPTPFQLDPEMREQQIHAYDGSESATFVTKNVLMASAQPAETFSWVVDDQLRGSQYARAAWPAHEMGKDISAAVAEISIPCIILAAEKDLVEPIERVTKEVHQRIRGSELKIIEGSGHLSPIESPGQISKEIRSFIEKE